MFFLKLLPVPLLLKLLYGSIFLVYVCVCVCVCVGGWNGWNMRSCGWENCNLKMCIYDVFGKLTSTLGVWQTSYFSFSFPSSFKNTTNKSRSCRIKLNKFGGNYYIGVSVSCENSGFSQLWNSVPIPALSSHTVVCLPLSMTKNEEC